MASHFQTHNRQLALNQDFDTVIVTKFEVGHGVGFRILVKQIIACI